MNVGPLVYVGKMDIVELVFALLGGAIAGAGVVYAVLQRKLSALAAERAATGAELKALGHQFHQVQSERDGARAELDRVKVEQAAAFATLKAERRAADDK